MPEQGSPPPYHRDAFRAKVDSMYQHYQAKMYRFALHMVQSPDLADDVVHEVFRRILEQPDQLPAPDKEEMYLHRASYREALHQIERARARIEQEGGIQCELPTSAPTPANMLRARVLTEAVDQAVSALPRRYQRAFRLRCIDGYTRRDVAQKLAISVKTVDEEIRRAKAMLREQLKEVWSEWRADVAGGE